MSDTTKVALMWALWIVALIVVAIFAPKQHLLMLSAALPLIFASLFILSD